MSKLKRYEKLETSATLAWLLMDFFWMNKFEYVSTIFGSVAVMMSLYAVIFYDNESRGGWYVLMAAFFWVMMNFCWVLGDTYSRNWLIIVANINFAICLFFSIFAFVIARKENKSLDFKRMKID